MSSDTPAKTISLTPRQILAVVVVVATSLFLTIEFAFLVEPAAAREVAAACRGLRPAPTNKAYGALPTSEPVDFTAQDFQGNQVKLSDYRGKVVFVNFWATWCNVCKSEKPGLSRMVQQLQSDDFVILTLASNPSWDEVRKLYPDGTPFQVLLDPPEGDEMIGQIASSFGLDKVPESFVIDREGRIRYYFVNKRDWDAGVVETCLRSVMDE